MTTITRRTTMAALGLTAAATVLVLGTSTSPAGAHADSGSSSYPKSIDDVVAYRHLQQSEDLLATGLYLYR